MSEITGATSEPTVILPGPGEPWDLLYMGCQFGGPDAGLSNAYAQRAAEALGIEVRVHDWTISDLSPEKLFQQLKLSTYEDTVRDAEIIVVGSLHPHILEYLGKAEACVLDSTEGRDPPAPIESDDWETYRDQLNAVYQRIWELREGVPTVLRAIDHPAPLVSVWRQAGIDQECTAIWDDWATVMNESAAANAATLVSLYDLLNGSGRDEDPIEMGYAESPYGLSTSSGAAIIGDALAAVGFEPAPPP